MNDRAAPAWHRMGAYRKHLRNTSLAGGEVGSVGGASRRSCERPTERMTIDDRTPVRCIGAFAALLAAAAIAAACGGSSATSAPQPTTTSGTTAAADGARTPGGRFGNRTPPPALQTSIAQGTPPPFGNRTPSGAVATAIAQGTPRSALRGFRGSGRVVTDVAAILGIDEAQVRSELQAPNASIEKVAAAHGVDRATIRQKLIDATTQRLNAAVAAGMMTQQMADDQATQFSSNIDRTLDEVGGAPGLDTPTATP
jgi:hypothetical protein